MVRVALFSSGSLWRPRNHLKPTTFGRPGSSTKHVIVNGRFFITCWGSYEIEAGPGLSIDTANKQLVIYTGNSDQTSSSFFFVISQPIFLCIYKKIKNAPY